MENTKVKTKNNKTPKTNEYQKRRGEGAIKRISEEYSNGQAKGKNLYVIQCDKYYKIGIASSMKSRMVGLQCGNPYPLKLVFAIRKKMAQSLEISLHKELKKHNLHIRGEWFELEDDFIEDLKKFIENYE